MNNSKQRILILGISGMLGSTLFRVFSANPDFITYGSVRSTSILKYFSEFTHNKIITNIDVENSDALLRLFAQTKPDIVINCIGIVKQLADADNALISIPINSLLPHRLAHLCQINHARLIHMSTDCVFSGKHGNYLESDLPDAEDMYGRSKLMGEVDYPNAITLRTSIIGKELNGNRSLISWFLAQEREVKGYKKAIFSGFPTVEIARIIQDYVIPHHELHGLYHLSAEPISKYELLMSVAKVYRKSITITPDTNYVIDRSLNSDRFRSVTGFIPKSWSELIESMYEFEINS
ncbi:SDR family oxidoreductase [Thiothrix unzii]|jgi:dTDP-4-dehydrorhamnose reductase|uniref:dTDP-4-dehydrorhamnose reductase family protein n=1 Tax=Thiothrix unzii TaxID=111769 RepID=UPI002A35E51F|nr:SDR family oxidoreductase [Thiothrix unzii]MDX9988232.1 SDR family oxidoreductase [Thiothrix unzii]